jgi:hypothetical protein
MKYRQHFESTIGSIRRERRYRVITDLERNPERPALDRLIRHFAALAKYWPSQLWSSG